LASCSTMYSAAVYSAAVYSAAVYSPAVYSAAVYSGSLLVGLLLSPTAMAQSDPRGEAPSNASSPNEVGQPGEVARDDDVDLLHATPDPTPPVPRPFQRPGAKPTVDVIEQAGVGGPTAFGSAGVLEVGGSGALLISEHFVAARFAPTAGLFIYDGVQLSYMHELYGTSTDVADSFATTMIVDVSLHVPLGDRLLGFIGAGPGVLYRDAQIGFGGKARAGIDVLIGRSGLFRPALFMTAMSIPLIDLQGHPTSSHWHSGMEIGYAVLF